MIWGICNLNYRQWKKKYKKIHGCNPDADIDKRKQIKKVKELFDEERKIKNVLNTFNNNTLVDGYDFNINEGLVRLAELKKEISTLTILAKKTQFFSTTNYNREVSVYKSCYNIEDAKNILKETQRELSALQVAIDKTNLNSSIEF